MIVATWNVNGIRARAAEFSAWLDRERPDVVCLQEFKASPEQVSEAIRDHPEYARFWHGQKGGYSGVSLHLRRGAFSAVPAFSHPSFDTETRIVQCNLGGLMVASVYIPNGGKDYPAKIAFMEQMAGYVAEIHAKGQELILCGDMNVARAEADVHPSQRDDKVIGQKPEE